MRMGDIKDYSQASIALEPLVELAHTYNVHMMLLHHLTKGESYSSPSDGFLGSQGIFASADLGLLMYKKGDVRTLLTDGPQRFDIDLPEITLHFDKETHVVSTGEPL